MSQLSRGWFLGLAVAALLIASARPAAADTITVNFDVAGAASQVFSGDTLTLLSLIGGSETLDFDVAKTVKINTLRWDIDYSPDASTVYPFSLSRLMTMSVGSQVLSQNGTLLITSCCDTLAWSAGLATVFDFGTYTVAVTPLAGDPITRGSIGTTSHDVNATFLAHRVPDGGTTLSLLGLAMFGIATVSRRFRRT